MSVAMGRRQAERATIAAMCAGMLCIGCARRAPQTGAPIADARSIGELGLSAGQFAYPRVLECDGDTLWVIDKAARVQRLDAATGEPLLWFMMPESELGKPVGMCIAPAPPGLSSSHPDNAALYIADTHYSRIMVYECPPMTAEWTDGKEHIPRLLGTIGSYGVEAGQFIYPTDVLVKSITDSNGTPVAERIYVAEYGGNDRVSLFDGSFVFQKSFGRHGSREDPGLAFDRPQCLTWSPDRHEILVTDARNHRVARLTPDGALIAWFGVPPTGGPATDDGAPTALNYPYGMIALQDGSILVAEFGGSCVHWLNPSTGASLGVYGIGGRGPGMLCNPWAITIVDEQAMVLDSGNNRIIAFPSPRPAAVEREVALQREK